MLSPPLSGYELLFLGSLCKVMFMHLPFFKPSFPLLKSFQVCSRSQLALHERSTRTITWAVSQYLALTIYCTVVTLVTLLSDDFAYFVEDCGEAILVMSVACFSLSLCLEHFPIVQIQFFSNLLSVSISYVHSTSIILLRLYK